MTRTINAGYGDALKAWETRIIGYVDKHDAHTTALANVSTTSSAAASTRS